MFLYLNNIESKFKGDYESSFQKRLFDNGIGTNVSYRTPIYAMPAYKELGYKKEDFPYSDRFCRSNISLPIFDYIPMEFVEKTVEIVNKLC